MAVKFSREVLKGTTKTQGDYHLQHRFNLEIDGVIVGGIHSVRGLEHEHETVEYMEGSDTVSHFRPGRQKSARVTIEKDWSSTSEFYKWFKTLVDGKVERKSVSIIYLNDAAEEAMRTNLFHCYPTKWAVSGLNAKNSAHASESIEVVFEQMELK